MVRRWRLVPEIEVRFLERERCQLAYRSDGVLSVRRIKDCRHSIGNAIAIRLSAARAVKLNIKPIIVKRQSVIGYVQRIMSVGMTY